MPTDLPARYPASRRKQLVPFIIMGAGLAFLFVLGFTMFDAHGAPLDDTSQRQPAASRHR